MTLLDFTIRIACAVGLGFFIGLERQLTGQVAGIRTNILVGLGACAFSLFSILVDAPDETRIAAQVVTGVGFLCTGIIFKEGLSIRGLNTAATIWCTAAIGVLCSSGHVLYAALASGILLFSNLLFRFIADRIKPLEHFDENENIYKLSVTCQNAIELNIRAAVLDHLKKNSHLHLSCLERADVIGEMAEIEATIHLTGKRSVLHIEKLTSAIALVEGVTKVGWELI